MKIFFYFLLIVFINISSCGWSDKKMGAFKDCFDSAKNLDIYEKDGTHISETQDGKAFIVKVCSTRAELYEEGYRIKKIVQDEDYKIYYNSEIQGKRLKNIYQELIKSGKEI
ncbi:hypothetical protein MCECIE61_00638 [Candidatus Methylopumilus planktonicus]|uniref:hypothetical protein n=1 Tax=Candidatus Methylopumilus planktonicus TaxID=1581557 RepID=UPI003BEF1BCE